MMLLYMYCTYVHNCIGGKIFQMIFIFENFENSQAFSKIFFEINTVYKCYHACVLTELNVFENSF